MKKLKSVKKPFWPCILRTDPPTIMTEEEAYAKVPYMTNFHVPATHPRDEGGAQSGPEIK
jgi:hypothetical protein